MLIRNIYEICIYIVNKNVSKLLNDWFVCIYTNIITFKLKITYSSCKVRIYEYIIISQITVINFHSLADIPSNNKNVVLKPKLFYFRNNYILNSKQC